jgi:Doubled CXXCH motif (Paired_CXXCH_1)
MGRIPRTGSSRSSAFTFALATLCVLPARAGDYHEGATLDCAECHVMHTFGNQQSTQGREMRKSALVGPLLKKDVNELCLSCHDGSSKAPDVLGQNQGKYPGDVREAGYLNRLGVGPSATGHTLGSTEFAPGSRPPWSAELENGPGVGLSCTNCHAAHGSDHAYRNLRSDAGRNPAGRGLVTYNDGHTTNDLARDVYVRHSLRYDESDVDFNEPDGRDSAIGRFCAGCHDEFHGKPGDARMGGKLGASGRYGGFARHPASGVDLSAGTGGSASLQLFNGHTGRVKVMSGLGRWDPAGADATPTCISCHKAHGNGNAFGLIFRSGRGTPTEDGDSQGTSIEALCGQCHGTGSPFAND